MPQRPVPDYWKARVKFHLSESGGKLTARQVLRKLEAEAAALEQTGKPEEIGLARERPSARSIGRIRQLEWERLSDREKAVHRLFRWPEAMIDGALPWEASRPALELLRHLADIGQGRPTVRRVRWFWRVTQAVPDAPLQERQKLAAYLLLIEAMAPGDAARLAAVGAPAELLLPPVPMKKGAAPSQLRAVEGRLVYQPWRSDQDEAAYEAAQDRKSEPVPPDAISFNSRDPEAMKAHREAFRGIEKDYSVLRLDLEKDPWEDNREEGKEGQP